jgi:ABC-type antimicrobial peptide transport system permease subunit
VRALLLQVGIVLGVGAAALLDGAGFSISVSPRPATLVTTSALVCALALVTSLVAVRRILAIDPIRAVAGAGVGQ